jgi:hypothetical protein
MNIRSAVVLLELEEILKANNLIDKVESAKPIIAIAQETAKVATYISFISSSPRSKGTSPEMDNYDFHGFFTITVNADCVNDKLFIYDVVDSIQRSILNDSGIWNHLVDRDILTVEYDNAEFYPKRSAIVAIEVMYRLTCN